MRNWSLNFDSTVELVLILPASAVVPFFAGIVFCDESSAGSRRKRSISIRLVIAGPAGRSFLYNNRRCFYMSKDFLQDYSLNPVLFPYIFNKIFLPVFTEILLCKVKGQGFPCYWQVSLDTWKSWNAAGTCRQHGCFPFFVGGVKNIEFFSSPQFIR